ncbi:MAG: hypothetical protein CMO55_13485 [Verrucomicrobiales bacterium]|nr:hypothetical protein [Verrucomicrobiales bacterium]
MPGTAPSLESKFCRSRQETLRRYLSENDLDGAVFFDRHYIYSLTGYWHEQPLTPTALLLETDGGATIVTHFEDPVAPAADKVVPYVPNHLFTLKPNLCGCVTEVLNPLLAGLKIVGTEQQTPAALIEGPVCRDISEDYQYLRRHKDDDEVAALEYTIRSADRAYTEAKRLIEPGILEVEVMASMLEEATYSAGEVLSGWGQDYACGVPGGFARKRKIEESELYVLDVGVGIRGYRSDLCRTFSVAKNPTDEQYAAWEKVVEVMEMGKGMIRPGQSCKEMFEAVTEALDGWNGFSFFHHAGHGIGLDAHEVPRINSGWDDTFEVGDVVAFEPGLYGGALHGGIRLENNYLVTEDGNRQLSHFPLDLV